MTIENEVDKLLESKHISVKKKEKPVRPKSNFYYFLLFIILVCMGSYLALPLFDNKFKKENIKSQTDKQSKLGAFDNWAYYRDIWIQSDYVNQTLEDFPVTLAIDFSDIDDAKLDDGKDIVFAINNGTGIELDFDLDNNSFNENGINIYHIKIPRLEASTNTSIRMYYHNTGASSSHEQEESTFSNGYIGVWHLHEGAGNAIDVSSRGEDGTFIDSLPNSQTGKINNGQNLDGISDSITVTTYQIDSNTNGLTFEQWVKPNFADSNVNNYRSLRFRVGGDDNFGLLWRGVAHEWWVSWSNDNVEVANTHTQNQWYYMAGAASTGGTATFRGYLNGELKGTNSTGDDVQGTNTLFIGIGHNGLNDWPGMLDEVRISHTERNSSWINASFMFQNDPSETNAFEIGPETSNAAEETWNQLQQFNISFSNNTELIQLQQFNISFRNISSPQWNQLQQFNISFSNNTELIQLQQFNISFSNNTEWIQNQQFNISFSNNTNSAPNIASASIANNSYNVPITTNYFNCTITDIDADDFNWTIQVSNGDSSSGNKELNGTKSCQLLSGLNYKTDYIVWVNATDGNLSKEAKFYFSTKNQTTFVLWADTHYGNDQGDGAANDITDSINWIKYKNPDQILHIGDIVDDGTTAQINSAVSGFNDLINNTDVEKIWFTLGGGHDGYFNRDDDTWEGIQFGRDLNLTSLWYVIEKGNTAFIFCSIIQGDTSWSSGWGGDGDGHFIPQNKIDWLESVLQEYNSTNYNVVVVSHTQIYETNAYSDTGDWAQMDKEEWHNTSSRLKNLFDSYNVDVYIHGHLHMDPNASGGGADIGNVLLRDYNVTLPSTTFLHATDVCWEHGGLTGTKSTFASVMWFNLTEGNDYFDLFAVDVNNNKSVGITYNDTSATQSYIRVPLSNSINQESGNQPYEIDNFEQSFAPYQMSNEANYQWWKDSEGMMVGTNSWFTSRFDLWQSRNFDAASLDINTSDISKLSFKIYYSTDGMQTWSSDWYDENNITSMPNARWLEVNTTITTASTVYIYDIDINLSGYMESWNQLQQFNISFSNNTELIQLQQFNISFSNNPEWIQNQQFNISFRNISSPQWNQLQQFEISFSNNAEWIQLQQFQISFSNNTPSDPINITDEYPSNNSYIQTLQPTIYFTLISTNGLQMNYSIYYGNSTSNTTNLFTTVNNVTNGTYHYVNYFTASNYSINYYWRVEVNDGTYALNETFSFMPIRSGGMISSSNVGLAIGAGALLMAVFAFIIARRRKGNG